MWGPAIVMVSVVCLSVCLSHANISETKQSVWLLGNSNRKPDFPIQNLPSDLRSEVRFRHFGCFRVGTLPIQTEMGQWASECSEWINGNSHQPAPHWALWRACYRQSHNGQYCVNKFFVFFLFFSFSLSVLLN